MPHADYTVTGRACRTPTKSELTALHQTDANARYLTNRSLESPKTQYSYIITENQSTVITTPFNLHAGSISPHSYHLCASVCIHSRAQAQLSSLWIWLDDAGVGGSQLWSLRASTCSKLSYPTPTQHHDHGVHKQNLRRVSTARLPVQQRPNTQNRTSHTSVVPYIGIRPPPLYLIPTPNTSHPSRRPSTPTQKNPNSDLHVYVTVPQVRTATCPTVMRPRTEWGTPAASQAPPARKN